MNFNETQRLNVLAKELQEHGMACSSAEAVEKANKMIQVTEGKVPEEEDKFQLLERKYKFLLEQNSNRVANEMNLIKDSMNSLISELNTIKAQMKQQAEQLREKKNNQQEKIEVQQKIEDKKETGIFQSEDISVEKIFYCGKK